MIDTATVCAKHEHRFDGSLDIAKRVLAFSHLESEDPICQQTGTLLTLLEMNHTPLLLSRVEATAMVHGMFGTKL